MNVLVLAPHPDDETIGCGGAIHLHVLAGDRVRVTCLTSGELGLGHLPPSEARSIREAEVAVAASVLGVTDVQCLQLPDWGLRDHLAAAAGVLVRAISDTRWDLIYVPHPDDEHPDHAAAIDVLLIALARRGNWPQIRTYEVWTPLSRFVHALDITQVFDTKMQALRAHRSQLDHFDYRRAVSGLASYRGALAARTQFAEVFGEPARDELQERLGTLTAAAEGGPTA